MKEGGGSVGPWLALGVGGALVGGYIAWEIGGPTLRVLAVVFVGALALSAVIGASALPIRAWKRQDAPPIVREHHYHDGSTKVIERHTIDGRAAEGPKLFQMPAAPTNIYPALLSAAWQAGQLAPHSELPVEAELREVPPDEWSAQSQSWGHP